MKPVSEDRYETLLVVTSGGEEAAMKPVSEDRYEEVDLGPRDLRNPEPQ